MFKVIDLVKGKRKEPKKRVSTVSSKLNDLASKRIAEIEEKVERDFDRKHNESVQFIIKDLDK